jgi:D-isomer specific 2-hydroxyacid dehydrogenase, NAD binding domain
MAHTAADSKLNGPLICLLCGTAGTSRDAAAGPVRHEVRPGLQTGFPVPLGGKTLGLLGAGHLGGAMVPVAKALGMDVIAWSQNLTQERCAELGVTKVTKDELRLAAHGTRRRRLPRGNTDPRRHRPRRLPADGAPVSE